MIPKIQNNDFENKFPQFYRKKSCTISPCENLSFTFYRTLKLVNNKQAY